MKNEIIIRKNLKKVKEKKIIMTIDIGKESNYCYGRIGELEIETFNFKHNQSGYSKVEEAIKKLQERSKVNEVIIGFESTGVYGEPLAHYFKSKNYEIRQVNPMHTKRAKEIEDNSPNKTDIKDPKVIANLIEMGKSLTVVIPREESAELRRLTELRESFIVHRTSLYNQIHSKVFLVFPEYFEIFKNVKSKSSQYILNKSVLPEEIKKLSVEKFGGKLKKISRGRKNIQTVRELIEKAKTSIGIKEGTKIIDYDVKEKLEIVKDINQRIENIEKKMSKSLEKIDYSANILSIRGIKSVLAAGIIGELGDIRDFKTTSEIEKFAGLDLFEVSSGKHKGKKHISKRGRSHLRKVLYQCALNVIRKGGILHSAYNEFLKRNKPKMIAIVSIMRKLLKIIFSIVKNNSVYDENYKNKKHAA